MSTLMERITTGRELSVRMTKSSEPELSWFLAATTFEYYKETGEPSLVHVDTYYRGWYLYLTPGTFGDPCAEEIAQRLISWVRHAMEVEMLVKEDPPLAPRLDSRARLVDLVRDRLAELRGSEGPSVG